MKSLDKCTIYISFKDRINRVLGGAWKKSLKKGKKF